MSHIIYLLIGIVVTLIVAIVLPHTSITGMSNELVKIMENNIAYGIGMTGFMLLACYFLGGTLVYAISKGE